jgi:ParB family chromosome partitioning protein
MSTSTKSRAYGEGLIKSREAVKAGNLAALLQINKDGVGQLAEAKIIPLTQIGANPDQPRRAFDESTLRELADSIKARGVLQPIRVRPHGDSYQIVAGERRFRAAQLAGLQVLPAVVVEQDDDGAYIDALIENIQREDLNPLDRGEALRRLRVNLGLQSWEDVGRLLGMSRQSVHNLLGLAELPEAVRDDLRSGELTEKHGRALRRLNLQPELQADAYQQIVEGKLSGDQSIALVRELRQHKTEPDPLSPIIVAAREIERRVDHLDYDLQRNDVSAADRRDAILALQRVASRLEAALSRLRA